MFGFLPDQTILYLYNLQNGATQTAASSPITGRTEMISTSLNNF